MKALVIDASVAVKWFLPEKDSEQAARLLSGTRRLVAPDLLWIEVAAVLWKVVRRSAITPDEAHRIIADAAAFPVETIESFSLLPEAMRIAMETGRTVYDSLYVSLAAVERSAVVTADERLVNALSQTTWARHVVLLGVD
ncbi:MAG: type II toxin-antitoxin system VapC family toxin [Phycisphaeraceae bacterium]|nr:type II toxin-antitoxin system VapC family toxin [Phycisphaeraceae bacterium]MBX3405980.1 type II toxin-antitoxin system VapC family toxin [Phycisphaeraceae bacterium]